MILLLVVLCATACIKFGTATPGSSCQTFLTGECLNSTELEFYEPTYSEQMVAWGKYIFSFSLNLKYTSECTSKTIMKQYWRHVPSQETYAAFGKNATSVKNAFEEEFESFTNLYYEKYPEVFERYSVVTILYNGGISLVGNKDFAGVPAGKDLSEIIEFGPYDTHRRLYPDIPLEYITMPKESVSFSVPLRDFQVVEENVNFELNIPVKVVMYLQWLNDKLIDPDAPVPYKEEVLHCRFTSPYCLKPTI